MAGVPHGDEHSLVKLGDATRMLAEVRDAPSAKKLMDVAAAAEVYARKAQLGKDAVQYAVGIKLDAERRLGQYLAAAPKSDGRRDGVLGGRPKNPCADREQGFRGAAAKIDVRSNQVRSRTSIPSASSPAPKRGATASSAPSAKWPPTLADLGISRKLSAESQRLAAIPDATFAKVKSGEIRPSVAMRQIKRDGLAAKVAALPTGTYRVIYADPPWKYGDERGGLVDLPSGVRAESAADAQYPPMEVDKICELGVRDLAQKDAVLFLWATFPLLADAMRVIPAWGFEYRTAFVWDKLRANVGNYHDASLELLLVCVRGSCPVEIDTRPKQIQAIARGKHSAKPEEFRALIDQLYPTGPRVELFRRGDAPAGWTTWGNEAT